MTDVSAIAVLTAFGAGIISFLSPCVLPLVPGYISYVAGDSLVNARHADDRASLKVHRVLRLVRQVRPAILHLRDPRFPVVRIHPVPVGQRLLALAIKALALGRGRLLDPLGLHQLRDCSS